MKSTIGNRLALTAALFSILVSAVAVLVGMGAAGRLFDDSYLENHLTLARTLAAAIDGDEHRLFTSPASAASPAYQRTLRLLRRVRATETDLTFLYTLNLDPATGLLTYAVDPDLAPGDLFRVETEAFAFSLSFGEPGESGPVVYYGQERLRLPMAVDVGGGRKWALTVRPDPAGGQEVRLGPVDLARVTAMEPLALQTGAGRLDGQSRWLAGRLELPDPGGPVAVHYAYSRRGEPRSGPGKPLADSPGDLAHARRVIEAGRDVVEHHPHRGSQGNSLAAYGIIRDAAGVPVGAVRIDLYEREIRRFRAMSLRSGLLAALCAFFLALALALLLARYWGAPIKRLSEAVNRIRGGQLDVRLPVHRRDELGRLAADFNGMAEALQRRTRELAESEERYRLMGEAIPYGVWLCGPDGGILYLSRSFQQLVGVSLEEAQRSGWPPLLHPDDRQPFLERWRHCLRTAEDWEYEYRVQARDGSWRTLLSRGKPARRSDGRVTGWAGIQLDITDRQRTERQLFELTEALERRVAERTAQLQAMALALTRTEQEERRRLAGFLHDHLQQLLAAARFNTQLVRLQAADEATRSAGRKADELISESMQAIRAMSIDLSPPIVYEEELDSVLRWLAEQMNERHGLRVDVDAGGWKGSLAEPIRIFLFLAVRELLFNTVKHAGVQAARVRLRRRGSRVLVEVSDEGAGFDPRQALKAAQARQEFGLFSIHERLKLLGGDLSIESAPGRGSRFTITLPARRAARRVAPRRPRAARRTRALEVDNP